MRLLLLPMMAACLWLAPVCAEAEDGGKKQGAGIAVIDFDYVDTSGEERDQRKEHEARLDAFMRALRDDIATRGSFRLVTPACTPNPCALAGSTVGDVLAAARDAGADILLIGGVQKMSTLVQWAKFSLIDVKAGTAVFDRLVTFRGDSDEAWRRAEAFTVRDILDREAEFTPPLAAALPRSP